jgi:hypothetical protein
LGKGGNTENATQKYSVIKYKRCEKRISSSHLTQQENIHFNTQDVLSNNSDKSITKNKLCFLYLFYNAINCGLSLCCKADEAHRKENTISGTVVIGRKTSKES